MTCILHVVDSLEPEAGTIGICLPGLFEVLQERDIASTSITIRDGGTPLRPLIEAADVVHIHGWGDELPRRAAKTALSVNKPYVISPLGAMTPGPHHKRSWREKLRALGGERGLIRNAAALLALNDREASDLSRRRVHRSVRFLPYGLDTAAYRLPLPRVEGLPDPPESKVLLLLGPVHPVEGHVPLLKAVAEMGREAADWSIVMAGREHGDWRKMIEAGVRRKGGESRVLFARASDVPTQRVWLDRASLLAAPSLHIHPPISAMQAIAAKVAVVASDLAAPVGMDSAIRLCPPKRSALTESLRALLALTDEELTALVQEARELGERTFDWSVLAQAYVDLYESLS
jgi:glycosyltransferase involved in cell wall biosynthesis